MTVSPPVFRHEAVIRQVLFDPFDVRIRLVDLVRATKIGTPAARAWLIASTVCGITPSSAATTSTTRIGHLGPRDRMAVKASWPGGVENVTQRGPTSTLYAPMCCVMPPCSCSVTFVSRIGVQQRGLPVVDVAHHGDDGRPRLQCSRRWAPRALFQHRLASKATFSTLYSNSDANSADVS